MKKNKLLLALFTTTFLLGPALRLTGSVRAESPADVRQYVGSETCMECHDDIGQPFQKTIHGRLADFELKGQPSGCESCHGPGQAHAEEGDPQKIIRLKELSPSEVGDICMKCHRNGMQMNWPGSAHDVNDVSCTDCHNPHATGRKLLTEPDPELCYSCHADRRAQMNYPSHHPIREKKMDCSSCHDPHGGDEGNLKADTVNELCFDCHAEKQGPFTFEHAPVVEDCSICHEAHGTVANHLQRQTEPFLCLQCHMGHEDSHHAFYSEQTWHVSGYSKCTQCHSQIHGSDFPTFSGHGRFVR